MNESLPYLLPYGPFTHGPILFLWKFFSCEWWGKLEPTWQWRRTVGRNGYIRTMQGRKKAIEGERNYVVFLLLFRLRLRVQSFDIRVAHF